ncbi:bifunctional riboflavin kinase/FAD synthetase [Gorillibacterium massiliense]|uniref:bifunctional riboflavin kinase/FAD synthetase n=1 Tax=Gorillibacterium massiliense TaxID=1280390 RepID=UPI0004B5BAF5|nr:bifunctional riboflavin kinase/FAD synthetase [Gorillibacterium massiliense]
MQVFELTYPFHFPYPGLPARQVLAIGDFDGVHLGHREVINRAVRTARRQQLPTAIMTFHPHPREVLGLDTYRAILTPLADKLEIFRSLGVDVAYVVTFNEDFAKMEPERFVQDILLPMGIDSVIVGFDFTFGRAGIGTADSLVSYGHGEFSVEIVRPFLRDGGKVSSTLIREKLQDGQVEQAAELLARPYSLQGTVGTGEQRGRTLNYPTANLQLSRPYAVPANGVYAVRVYLDKRRLDGVMNVGVKPTFAEDGLNRTLEVHLFDFNETIYGRELKVEFISFLRPEMKFSSIQELVAQIGKDAEAAKEKLLQG